MGYTNSLVSSRYHISYAISKIPSFSKWHSCYSGDIINMYNEYARIINKNYPRNKIDWDNDDIYDNFARMLYNSSSKYIE
jgi:hypothetical protein